MPFYSSDKGTRPSEAESVSPSIVPRWSSKSTLCRWCLSVDLGTHIVNLGHRLSGQVRRERHQLGVPDVKLLHGLISDFARCRSPDSNAYARRCEPPPAPLNHYIPSYRSPNPGRPCRRCTSRAGTWRLEFIPSGSPSMHHTTRMTGQFPASDCLCVRAL